MSISDPANLSLDYAQCVYGTSKVAFRGPRARLDGAYLSFLGGRETFGTFVERPFPMLVEGKLGLPAANLGVANAGLDLYLNEPSLIEVARMATVRVVQVLGAQNMSNRFYQVHPRRNDRFLCASDRLVRLFPEVDFTEFHFNRHLLGHLAGVSEQRYAVVVDELRTAWIARMKTLLTLLNAPTILLWFADHEVADTINPDLGDEALFVHRGMLEALRPRVFDLVEVTASDLALSDGTDGMVFSPLEVQAAEKTLGPRAHFEACEAICGPLAKIL